MIKYMLTRLIITREIEKWAAALAEFILQYLPQIAVKRQAIADFLTDHPSIDMPKLEEPKLNIFYLERVPWVRKFDGPSTNEAIRAGVVIVSRASIKTSLAFNLNFLWTNN